MRKIRLLVGDEEAIFRECICTVLRTCPDFEIVGEATTAEEIVEMVRRLAPDVVVMNLAVPVIDCCKAVRLLRSENESARVVLVTQNEEPEWVIAGLKTEADGYISKKASTEEVILAVRAVYRGEYFLQPAIARTIIEDYVQMGRHSTILPTVDRLTPREKMVLQLFAEGRPSEDIARSLHIEPSTVLCNRARIMRKLGISKASALRDFAGRQAKANVTQTTEYN